MSDSQTPPVARPCDDSHLKIALHDAIAQAVTVDGRRLYSFLSDDDIKNVVLQITEGSEALDELIAKHTAEQAREIEGLKADLKLMTERARWEGEHHDHFAVALRRAEAERDTARAALGRYGRHDHSCAGNFVDRPCSCGFGAALPPTPGDVT